MSGTNPTDKGKQDFRNEQEEEVVSTVLPSLCGSFIHHTIYATHLQQYPKSVSGSIWAFESENLRLHIVSIQHAEDREVKPLLPRLKKISTSCFSLKKKKN